MPKPSKQPSIKCVVCGRKFVSQEKLGAHLTKHINDDLQDPTEAWLDDQMEAISDEQFDSASDKLFASELGCRAVFLALCAIEAVAEENGDKETADACHLVMCGLARCRRGYLQSP